MSRPYFGKERPIAFAHRGGAKVWPENTIFAFERAQEIGYRHIETDVQLTKDGQLVVLHDAQLDRTTDGFGFVADKTMDELRRLDAGYRFSKDSGHSFPFRGQGIVLSTLEEVLVACPLLKFNIEIKPSAPECAEMVRDVIFACGAQERVLVASAQTVQVQRFRALNTGVCTSAGQREIVEFYSRAKLRGLPKFLPYDALQVPASHASLTVVTPRFVTQAHERGVQVHVWTINDSAHMRELLDMEVDGLMTDYPERLLHVCDMRKQTRT